MPNGLTGEGSGRFEFLVREAIGKLWVVHLQAAEKRIRGICVESRPEYPINVSDFVHTLAGQCKTKGVLKGEEFGDEEDQFSWERCQAWWSGLL